MTSTADMLACVALAVAGLMAAAWVVSLVRRDASVVDVVWGAAFVLAAWVAALTGDGDVTRSNLLVALITIWGARLTVHLARRNLTTGEDRRYRAMRRRSGPGFARRSLVTVFGLQGLLVMIVALPALVAMTATRPDGIHRLAMVGTALWAVGFAFETIGDAQLTRFLADESNDHKVMDRGLWRYTRHPNYFGDFCVWWGIYLVAAETTPARWAVIGPLTMTVLLTRVSGVALLERSIAQRRPGYADYVARTSSFLPMPPRSGATSRKSPSGDPR